MRDGDRCSGYQVSIVASVFGEDAYFVFLSVIEIAMLALIIWYAWTWRSEVPETEVT